MTEIDLIVLGFELTRRYAHDEWETAVFVNRGITVELNYRKSTMELDSTSVDVMQFVVDNPKLVHLQTLVNVYLQMGAE